MITRLTWMTIRFSIEHLILCFHYLSLDIIYFQINLWASSRSLLAERSSQRSENVYHFLLRASILSSIFSWAVWALVNQRTFDSVVFLLERRLRNRLIERLVETIKRCWVLFDLKRCDFFSRFLNRDLVFLIDRFSRSLVTVVWILATLTSQARTLSSILSRRTWRTICLMRVIFIIKD